MVLSTIWATGWTVNAMRLVQARKTYWEGWEWEFNETLRWNTYLAIVGVVVFAACEVVGRIEGWKGRKRADA